MKRRFFLRNGIITTPTPWVTGEYALQGKPSTLERTVFSDGLKAVVGTGGRVSTGPADERRKSPLVEFDKSYHDGRQSFGKPTKQLSHQTGIFQRLSFEK